MKTKMIYLMFCFNIVNHDRCTMYINKVRVIDFANAHNFLLQTTRAKAKLKARPSPGAKEKERAMI